MTEATAKQPRQYHPPATRLLCRREYVRGVVGSLAQLAKRHGINPYTLRDWAEADDWTGRRQEWLEKQNQSNENPEPATSNPPATALPPLSLGDLSALMLTRAHEYENHLVRLRAQLVDETDPVKVDRLCAAIGRLEDVFQTYACVPKPGSRKPAPAPSAPKKPVYAMPIGMEGEDLTRL